MKVQIDDAPVVSADHAFATGELYQQPTYLLMSPSDGFGHASLAAPLWRLSAVKRKLAIAVTPASTDLDGSSPIG
jgi:hypothetical protein